MIFLLSDHDESSVGECTTSEQEVEVQVTRLKERERISSHPPSFYGSTESPPTSPQSLLANFLMRSTSTDALGSPDTSSPNNTAAASTIELNYNEEEPNQTSASQSDLDYSLSDSSFLAVESVAEEEETNDIIAEEDTNNNNTSLLQKMANIMNSSALSPAINRLLQKEVAADKLAQYSLLLALSQNGKYAALGFLATYLVLVLLIWLPLWILAQIITEAGVYLFLLTSVVYGGRCLLRLLAFPGTNVKVYGEIENEFAKYSCRMLEGGASALEDFAKSIRAGASAEAKCKAMHLTGMDDNDGWELTDVSATHKRVDVYKNRVLGVYSEVLHCLLEEDGQGYDPSFPNADGNAANGSGGRNGFYRLGDNVSACKDTCKRNLCCHGGDYQSASSSSDVEGIQQTDFQRSPTNSGGLDVGRPSTTCYGNNPLVGDVGNMGNLTQQARDDGRELYELLTSILNDLSTLEYSSSNVMRIMEDKAQLKNATLSEETIGHATRLIQRANELREFVSRIKLSSDTENENEDSEQQQQQDEETEVGAEAVRHRLEEQGTSSSSSTMGMVWSAAQAFGNMIDPPPHKSIFGLDVIRGCFLARYHGARQFWVKRPTGSCGSENGRLDVIMIPSYTAVGEGKGPPKPPAESIIPLSPRKGRADGIVRAPSSGGENSDGKKRRAVLYCNPNAGLVEVATGMGLTGGNVDEDEDDEEREPTCWTEFYMEHGYDVYLFNYAGYGRSFGGSSWNDTSSTEFSHGLFAALKRVLFSTFLAFKPSSESLKSDAAAVAKHLVDVVGVDELLIHGESIGGMAAAGAARALTAVSGSPKSSTLLVCDRTFCNLEAVAQRLVGQWTGNAIRLLTPSWSTDVARDFMAARCPKIVLNDCADEIIHDYSSLKTGLSFAGELTKGQSNKVGWAMSSPLEYRIADLDCVGIADSRLASSLCQIKNNPIWPADKHVSWSEAHHFASCVKRIGKLATATKKRMQLEASFINTEEDEGIEVPLSTDESPAQPSTETNKRSQTEKISEGKALIKLWSNLLLCDGLCGHHLGHAVKEGFDCTIAWLCCAVIYGSQVLADKAEKRWDKKSTDISSTGSDDNCAFISEDFDSRPQGYEWDEDDISRHPVPIPEVLTSLKEMAAQKDALNEVEAELKYVIGMLEYIVSRITSKENVELALRRRNGYLDEHGISTGCFLNLHCGHNNQYSSEEREKLIALIRRSSGDHA